MKRIPSGPSLVGRTIIELVESETSAGVKLDNGQVLYLDACEFEDKEPSGKFIVWNQTDNVPASPDEFATTEDAEAFIKSFRKRFAKQGYYAAANGQRLPICDIELEVMPA